MLKLAHWAYKRHRLHMIHAWVPKIVVSLGGDCWFSETIFEIYDGCASQGARVKMKLWESLLEN